MKRFPYNQHVVSLWGVRETGAERINNVMGEKHGARRIKQESQYLPSSHFKHCPPILKKQF